MKKLILLLGLAIPLTGCGAMQNYNNGLQASQNAWHRQQSLLDEQNIIEVNKLKSLQREQEIQAARAEGQKAQAKAAGDAAAEIETAKGHAQSNRLEAASLTPELVKLQIMRTLSDKTVIYLPSSSLPIISSAAPQTSILKEVQAAQEQK